MQARIGLNRLKARPLASLLVITTTAGVLVSGRGLLQNPLGYFSQSITVISPSGLLPALMIMSCLSGYLACYWTSSRRLEMARAEYDILHQRLVNALEPAPATAPVTPVTHPAITRDRGRLIIRLEDDSVS